MILITPPVSLRPAAAPTCYILAKIQLKGAFKRHVNIYSLVLILFDYKPKQNKINLYFMMKSYSHTRLNTHI